MGKNKSYRQCMSVKGHIFLALGLCCSLICFSVVIRLAVVDGDVDCC